MDALKLKQCPDDRSCLNMGLIEDLHGALDVAVKALSKYAAGYTWRHIAQDALVEIEQIVKLDAG